MSEYEILDLYYSNQSQITLIMQWWVSVTFGLLAVGHFGAEKLNVFLLSLLVVLYSSFSFVMSGFFVEKSDTMRGYLGDLNALQQNGAALSPSTVEFVESGLQPIPWLANLIFLIALGGMFLATIGYVIYAYLRERQS